MSEYKIMSVATTFKVPSLHEASLQRRHFLPTKHQNVTKILKIYPS